MTEQGVSHGPWQVRRRVGSSTEAPNDIPLSDDGWFPAVVPGSVGACPQLGGLSAWAADADRYEWWWRRAFVVTHGRPLDLVWDSVATNATFAIDGLPVATSTNAFRQGRVELPQLAAGEHELSVRIAPLDEVGVPSKPRPRWRSALVADASLRWRRTPLLGRIPTWAGALPPVGILGDCRVERRGRPHVARLRTDRAVDGGGKVELLVASELQPPSLDVSLNGTSLPSCWQHAELPGMWLATVDLGPIEPWWPHTHGSPATYRLVISDDDGVILSRRVGFSTIAADRTGGRFGIRVNDQPVFVRGACWVPPDPVGWTSNASVYRADMTRLADSGINAVRVTGTNRYEPEVFWDLTAELGLMVWQDVMLATLDPPEEPAWLGEFEAELVDQFSRLQGRPNVAVVCGGTETEQQPALMGLAPERYRMSAIHDVTPRVLASVLPNVPHVVSSPSGGPLPVSLDRGVSHYFGVGAYERPLDDARSAQISFASECLAFSIPPEERTVQEDFPDWGVPLTLERWQAGVPRDRNVDWDFADTTNHYVSRFFGVQRADIADDRWRDLQRAAVVHAMTRSFAIWRASATPTRGAIVLSHRDLTAGPGWGLLDWRGRPKAPLLALSDVLSPQAVLPVDKGLDGVHLEVCNDTSTALIGSLQIEVYGTAARPIADAQVPISVPARGSVPIHLEAALGGFRDLNWTWRFGDRSYEAVLCRLLNENGQLISQHVVLLGHPRCDESSEPGLSASWRRVGDDIEVSITAERLVQFVHLSPLEGWNPTSGWFHLVPGQTRVISCVRDQAGIHGAAGPDRPTVSVGAIAGSLPVEARSYGR